MLRALRDLLMRAKLPRIGAHAAAAAQDATTALSLLPLSVVLHIFSLLPVDCRLRCAEVCRGWRAVLSERSLWTRLELTAESGVRVPERYDDTLNALLRCAAARAGGGLQLLHVDTSRVSLATLLEVAAANAGALRELHAHDESTSRPVGFTAARLEALLGAAPQLRVLATELFCDTAEMQATCRALCNEAPFAPLRVRHLFAYLLNVDAAGVVALAAEVAAHASLTGLALSQAPLHTPAALDAVVDAALARRMHTIALRECGLSPASAPALARLLSSDALTTLKCVHMDLLDAPAARVLAAALRANSTLTSLTLDNAGVFDDAAAGAELLGALTGHARLRVLSLRNNRAVHDAHQAAVGAALGALLAANAPALTELDVSLCNLREDSLRALFEALPHNTHLRELNCSYNFMSDAFGRDVLLPAVRANTSLRMLVIELNFESSAEAEAVVNSRAAA
jgi:hypothetical protein